MGLEGLERLAHRTIRSFRGLRWGSEQRRAIHQYLGSSGPYRLHLGCGGYLLPAWLNTDYFPNKKEVVFLDVGRPFPIPNTSFDRIFSEHVIEHMPFDEGVSMIRESLRILKPGGRMRIATPDLRIIAGLMREPLDEDQRYYVKKMRDDYLPETPEGFASFVVNNAFRAWGHRFLYDQETLTWLLKTEGARDVVRCKSGTSNDEAFQGVETRGRTSGDRRLDLFETMILEATK